MKRTQSIAWALALFLATPGCKKMIEVSPPAEQLSTFTVFSDSATANAAVAGIYYKLSDLFISRSLTLISSMSADELSSLNVFEDKYVNNSIPANDGTIGLIWNSLYNAVYQSNAVIRGLGASSLAEPVRTRLAAEAKFLRAFCYFYLTNLWGDVPLLNTTAVTETSLAARTSQPLVYTQIVKDLKEAQADLSPGYAAERVRANRFVASALLARVYLYLKDWNSAKTEAEKLTGSGLYSLLPLATNGIFLKNSTETILQLWMQNGYAWLGTSFIPATANASSNYFFTQGLLNEFETSDARKTAWTKNFSLQSTVYYYPYKYRLRTTGTSGTAEYSMVLRYAEVVLIRAEALAQLGLLDESLAELNKIRQRAGLSLLLPSQTRETLLAAIDKERRLELFAEWGHRWLDLKRTGRAAEVLSVIKPSWKPYSLLWPIPQQELSKNSNLVQNPGY